MPDIQEAKCFELTAQILPPPHFFWQISPLHRIISVYALACSGSGLHDKLNMFKKSNQVSGKKKLCLKSLKILIEMKIY